MAVSVARKRKFAALIILSADWIWEPPKKKKKKRVHSVWVKPWLGRRNDSDTDTLFTLQKELLREENYTEYRQLLRMDEDTYQFLLGKIRQKIAKQDTTWRKAIPADQRLSVTLRYLATGHFQTDIKRDYRVSQPRVGVILRDTCEAIIDCLHEEYFETPKEPEDWQKIANLFWQRWNFPHCLGGLDGKHIKVRTPINSGSLYFNYKGQFSIVLMALVDANYLFRWIDVGAEGRVADGGVWRKCALKKAIDNDTAGLPLPSALPGTDLQAPYVIVGDDAFSIDEHLLKPFSRRGLSDREAVFNYRLSRARRVTENAFGILANRFGCLLNKMVLNPDAATAVVMACCLLHNMLRQRCGRNYIPEGAVDSEDSQHYFIPGEWRRNNELPSIYPAVGRKPNNIGRRSRETLADFFQTTTGRVSWQQRAIDE